MSPSEPGANKPGLFSLQSSRALRWTVVVGTSAIAAIGLVLMFLLTQATNNRDMYERNYARLFTLNVVVAVLLLAAIGWIAYRLASWCAGAALAAGCWSNWRRFLHWLALRLGC